MAAQLNSVQWEGGALVANDLYVFHNILWTDPKMCGMEHREVNLLIKNALLDKNKRLSQKKIITFLNITLEDVWHTIEGCGSARMFFFLPDNCIMCGAIAERHRQVHERFVDVGIIILQ